MVSSTLFNMVSSISSLLGTSLSRYRVVFRSSSSNPAGSSALSPAAVSKHESYYSWCFNRQISFLVLFKPSFMAT